jgi:hypothetical protein
MRSHFTAPRITPLSSGRPPASAPRAVRARHWNVGQQPPLTMASRVFPSLVSSRQACPGMGCSRSCAGNVAEPGDYCRNFAFANQSGEGGGREREPRSNRGRNQNGIRAKYGPAEDAFAELDSAGLSSPRHLERHPVSHLHNEIAAHPSLDPFHAF